MDPTGGRTIPSGQEDILEKKRLESFEKMLAAVEKEYQDIQGKMEDLKAKGRVKSAPTSSLWDGR